MAQTSAPGQMAGKPLIESDRVKGTTVLDRMARVSAQSSDS
jgi:hypothetical protein